MDISKLNDDQLELADKIGESAKKYGLNPDFVLPMVMQESGFNHGLKSPKGAVGIMQITPETAKTYGCDDINDVNQNIDCGLRIVKSLTDHPKIGNDPYKVLAGYNAGPNTKFFQTGDLTDLPDETLNHMDMVTNHAGGTLPQVLGGTSEEPKVKPGYVDNTPEPSNDAAANAAENPTGMYGTPMQSGAVGAATGAALGAASAGKNIVADVYDALKNRVTNTPNGGAPGSKWLSKVGGINRPDVASVREGANIYNRSKSTGKVTGRLFSKYGPVVPNSLVPEVAQEAAPIAEESPSILKNMAKYLGSNIVKGGLSGLGVGFGAQDAYLRSKRNDPLGATIAGTGAAASALAPFVGGSVLGPVAATAPLVNATLDYYKKHPELREQISENANLIGP